MPNPGLPQVTQAAIAADLASGVPTAEILEKFGVRSRQTLAKIARRYGVPPEARPGGKPRTRLVVPGAQFGRLTVIFEVEGSSPRLVRCACECGAEAICELSALSRGAKRSCGCLQREVAGARFAKQNRTPQRRQMSRELAARHLNTPEGRERSAAASSRANRTHGLGRHPLYSTWNGMIRRCHNPSAGEYRNYGARGICVCDEWRDVRAFVDWIEANLGGRPAGNSLDRINNDGNYEPGNVRWAGRHVQSLNRRTVASLSAERDDLLALVASLRAETGRMF
jgi:hypothetical protein